MPVVLLSIFSERSIVNSQRYSRSGKDGVKCTYLVIYACLGNSNLFVPFEGDKISLTKRKTKGWESS